jgi:hypothetical protein
MAKTPAPEEIESQIQTLRKLSNSARYDEAYALAKRLMEKYPSVLQFVHYEAVMTAEDDTGYSPAEIRARYKLAAKKLRALLRRLNGAPLDFRAAVRNEYYWFSRQPMKQYRLGQEMVKKGRLRSYYSQGVGAEELAKKYALEGKKALALKWAKISEAAWLKFFEVDPRWFNSYFFYGMVLGYQGRLKEMEAALTRAAKLVGKTPRWPPLNEVRRDVEKVRRALR